MRLIVLAVLAVSLAACSKPSLADKAAIMPAGELSPSAAAATEEAVNAWVADLYAHYGKDPRFNPTRDPDKWFDYGLRDELKRAQQLTPEGDPGVLGGDPVCHCRDTKDMGVMIEEVALTGPTTATARIKLTFPTPAGKTGEYGNTVVLQLALGGTTWSIHDVEGEGDGESLLTYLRSANAQRELAAMSQGQRPPPRPPR